MTFADARARKLIQLRHACDALVALMADPKLQNPGYPKLFDTTKQIADIAGDIIKINNVEQEAQG